MQVKRLLLFILLMAAAFLCMDCRAYAAKGLEQYYDKSAITLRRPDNAELERVRNDKAFKYEKEMIPGNAFADLIRSWFSWLWEHFFSHIFSKNTAPFWRVFPYVIMAAALIITILALRRGSFFGLFSRRGKAAGSVFYYADENIHGIDFDSMIQKFADEKNYRMALRYRFLRTLKYLSSNNVIEWHKEKTNRDYVKEIGNGHNRSYFNELVNIFEYVWYGSFNIEKEYFDRMNERFASFEATMGTAFLEK